MKIFFLYCEHHGQSRKNEGKKEGRRGRMFRHTLPTINDDSKQANMV